MTFTADIQSFASQDLWLSLVVIDFDQYTGVEPVIIVAATYTPWSILERLESANSTFIVLPPGLEPGTY